MKTQRATYTVEYWSCPVASHRHQFQETAQRCCDKPGRKYKKQDQEMFFDSIYWKKQGRMVRIADLRERGFTYRQIGAMLDGISSARVAELNSKWGRLVKWRAKHEVVLLPLCKAIAEASRAP